MTTTEVITSGQELVDLAVAYGLQPLEVVAVHVDHDVVTFVCWSRNAAGERWIDPDTGELAKHVVTWRARPTTTRRNR